MTDIWLKAINKGKLVGCAMIDFRKGFDFIVHKLLLNILGIYEGRSICNENSLIYPKVLHLHTS